jgi:hypothetical protein
MTLNELYDRAESIARVDDIRLDSARSFSLLTDGGDCYIALDSRRFKTRAAEMVALAHEAGHCATGSFYCRDTPGICRGRLEHLADAWAYSAVLPPGDIQSAINGGCASVWDLAEALGVPVGFLRAAIEYYTERRGIRFEAPWDA